MRELKILAWMRVAEACVKFDWDSLHEMTFKVKLKEDLLYDLHS